jgi:glycosyltransferase involved in cell wall biosynthesis
MNSSPLFSIVIPTYNRSELVRGAVLSVLAQTFGDFEVVVSDNCSEDDTREVVQAFSDPRVRYVQTASHGTIGDSWEFARSQAKGTLVMMLSDDDALLPETLATFAEAHRWHDADFLFCKLAEYKDASFPGPEQNTVICPAFSGMTRVVSKADFLAPLFSFRGKFNMHPSAFMFASRIADEVVRRTGRFFRTNGVEYFAWPLAAVFCRNIAYIELPLVILGRTSKSWGANIVLTNPGKRQIEKMIADVQHDRSWIPLTNFTLANLVAEGLLRAKQLFPEELKPYPFDEQQYLRRTLKELRNRRGMGVDVDREMQELFDYADKYSLLKAELIEQNAKPLPRESGLRRVARKLGGGEVSRRLNAWSEVRRIKRGEVASGFAASGADFGFVDALGCAAFLSRVVSPVSAPAEGARAEKPRQARVSAQ